MKEQFGVKTFDLVFLDHWKDRYLPDTKLMEASQLCSFYSGAQLIKMLSESQHSIFKSQELHQFNKGKMWHNIYKTFK